MMDARAVLEAFRDGKVPNDWQVVHAHKSFFVGEGAFRLVMAVLVAPIGLTLVAFTVLAGSLLDWGSRLGMLALAAAILGFSWWAGNEAFRLLRRVKTARDDVLVLMPEGCVQGDVQSVTVEYQAVYLQIQDISLKVGATRAGPLVSLEILPRGSAHTNWRLDDRFWAAAEMAQRILHDYTRCTAQHNPAANDSRPT